MPHKKYIFQLLLILISVIVFAQKPYNLNAEVQKLLDDKTLIHATWSFCVMPVNKDIVIAEHNSLTGIVPASTLKTITTATALSMLGSDYKFKTKIQYDGTFDSISGVLKGNLYIIGGGDPTIDSKYFKDKNDTLSTTDKWAIILKYKGIKKIEGAVIADASIFEDNMISSQWIWSDIGNYYGAGACGLSYHDNMYTVFINSASTGSMPSINKIEPQVEGLQLINKLSSGSKTDSAFIYGSPYTNYRFIEGSIPANQTNFTVDGSIPDPALFCAQSLEKSLSKLGIYISQKATTVRHLKEQGLYSATSKKLLYTHVSPPLEKIVYWTNSKSINLYAEHLLKYIAYIKTGTGKVDKGIELVMNHWEDRGIDLSGMVIYDGSGLSRANIITTKIQAQVLRKMALDKNFKAYYNSFPVGGKPGSLAGMFAGSFAENNLCAKSGYITGARGYAGYVKNKKGNMLCFSIIANNYTCSPTEMKKKLERIMMAIAELDY